MFDRSIALSLALMTLAPAGTLVGTVERRFRACPGAVLGIDGTRLHARCDEFGGFVLAGVPAGDHGLTIQLRDGATEHRRVLVHGGAVVRLYLHPELAAEDPHVAEPTAPWPGTLVGTLRDSAGCPTTNADVEVAVSHFATSDPNGHFCVTDVPPGRWAVKIYADAVRPIPLEDSVDVWSGETTQRDWVLPRPDLRRLTSEQPRPAFETHASYGPSAAGTFILPHVGDGYGAPADTAEGRDRDEFIGRTDRVGEFALQVNDDQSPRLWISFALAAGTQFTRLAIADDAGIVVREWCAAANFPDRGAIWWEGHLSADVNAPPGGYRVRFETTAGAVEMPFCLRWTHLMAHPAPTDDSTSTGILTGVVRDRAGRPQPRARVTVFGTRLAAHTDERGRFEITRVPAGVHPITFVVVGDVPRTILLHVAGGATSDAGTIVVDPLPVGAE